MTLDDWENIFRDTFVGKSDYEFTFYSDFVNNLTDWLLDNNLYINAIPILREYNYCATTFDKMLKENKIIFSSTHSNWFTFKDFLELTNELR